MTLAGRRRFPATVAAFAVTASAVAAFAAGAWLVALFSSAIRVRSSVIATLTAAELVATLCFLLVYPEPAGFSYRTQIIMGTLMRGEGHVGGVSRSAVRRCPGSMPITFQPAADEKPSTVARNGWNRSRIRTAAFWGTTLVVVFELIAGSVWNLLTIDWIEAQLGHLGYPHFFAYILGVCHVGAAVAIIAPGFRLLKEWAYAGAFFLWSGAVVSHLALGDGPVSWGPPLMFAGFAVASWVLRPADRRLPETRLRRDRPADTGQDGPGRPGNRPRAWAAPIGLVVVLYAVSLLTLPVMEDVTRGWAVERGWLDE